MARRGRHRKAGERYANGQLKRVVDPAIEDCAEQPHRRCLKPEQRLAPEAESTLGRLYLAGHLARPYDELVPSHEPALFRYHAGLRLRTIVGAYRAVIGTPRATAGGGRGFGCAVDVANDADVCWLDPEGCQCLARRERYERAFAALAGSGHRAAKAVARLAVADEAIDPSELVYLIDGLDALVKHFGLTARRPREHSR